MARDRLVEREWTLEEMSVTTNVGTQLIDMKCRLIKTFFSGDLTLVEKYILGYKDYFYRIELEHTPIRENRDKDYLGAYTDEGNDATYSCSIGLGLNRGNIDISPDACHKKILEYLADFNPDIKRLKSKARREKKDWRSRTFFRKSFNEYNEEIGMFSNIYPFHGDDLSGWTDIFELSITNDDEDGLGLSIALFGFHFYFHSRKLQKLILEPFIKNHPRKTRNNMAWEPYYKLLKQWQKDYKFEYFCDSNWRFEIGVNRANGFFIKREFDHECKSGWNKYFNPWRNRLWRLF